MWPGASVSGLYFSHPQSQYFVRRPASAATRSRTTPSARAGPSPRPRSGSRRTSATAPTTSDRLAGRAWASGLGWTVTSSPDIPQLRDPWMVAAFEGWNDAADAASGAVDHLIEEWDAELLIELDPEEYYDFQVHRPQVHSDDDGERVVAVAGAADLPRPATPQRPRRAAAARARAELPLEGVLLDGDRRGQARRRHRAGDARARCSPTRRTRVRCRSAARRTTRR